METSFNDIQSIRNVFDRIAQGRSVLIQRFTGTILNKIYHLVELMYSCKAIQSVKLKKIITANADIYKVFLINQNMI